MQQAIENKLSPEELRLKLFHLAGVLSAAGCDAVVLSSEGALRWLTGMKHQLGDIAPFAPSPVQALIKLQRESLFEITIISKPFEMPRLKDEIPAVFGAVDEVTFNFCEQLPELTKHTLSPEAADYAQWVDAIVRPLPGGLEGESYRRLDRLSRNSMRALAETASQLDEGMNGLNVRGLVLNNLAKHGIDANLVLVALNGQEAHLHPIASAQYQIKRECWMKLVVGARCAEHIVSQSLMVKLGGSISEPEAKVYRALQQASVDYADLYREGVRESDIYADMIECFRQVERESDLPGFARSAMLHHPGGGTSPLGNRDRMLNPDGMLTCEPWTQFAINPVDALRSFKVELQGVIVPGGKPPLILDMHSDAQELLPFRTVVSRGGTQAVLPDLLIV